MAEDTYRMSTHTGKKENVRVVFFFFFQLRNGEGKGRMLGKMRKYVKIWHQPRAVEMFPKHATLHAIKELWQHIA